MGHPDWRQEKFIKTSRVAIPTVFIFHQNICPYTYIYTFWPISLNRIVRQTDKLSLCIKTVSYIQKLNWTPATLILILPLKWQRSRKWHQVELFRFLYFIFSIPSWNIFKDNQFHCLLLSLVGLCRTVPFSCVSHYFIVFFVLSYFYAFFLFIAQNQIQLLTYCDTMFGSCLFNVFYFF